MSALPSRAGRTAALFLVLAAFALRVFRLDLQSLWSDEGLSIYRASQDLASIAGLSTAGIHPPLYDSLLHFWILLAGNKEYATRFFSLFFGVLTIALLFQVGRSVAERWAAVLAALVATASPFLVYYSQETRMYAPALFFSLLSVAACLRWLQGRGTNAWLLCYLAAAAAAVYTHYYAWLAVAFLNIFLLLWVWGSGLAARARLAPWATAQIALGLAYLPWAGVLVNKYETYLTPDPGSSLGIILYQTIVSFGLGYSVGQAGATPGQMDKLQDHWIVLSLALALLALAIWGAVSGRWQTLTQRAFLPLYLALPIMFIVLLSWGKRDFAPRYLIFAAPAYYLLMGKGLASFFSNWKAWGALPLLLVLGASGWSLHHYYYDPTYWRDDMRGMAEYLNSRSRQGDAVILDAYYLRPTFDYYYQGEALVVGLPDSVPANWEEDLASLQKMASQHERLWLVLWQSYFTDPEGRIQEWLDERAIPFQEESFRGGIFIIGYLTRPPIVKEIPEGQPLGMVLGHTVELAAHRLPPNPLCAGEDIPLTIYWRALRPIPKDYSVFMHLIDGGGKTWSRGDSQPVGGGFPTSHWPVGSLIVDERWLGIPAETPPGQYFIEMGMYDLNTMKRLGEGDPEPFQYAFGPLQVLPVGCKD